MKPYSVAVLGYGNVAKAHINAINATSLARVTAIYSSRPQDRAELESRHGGPLEISSDLPALLRRPDIRAVSICSAPDQHVAQVLAAAAAGKHIILEKPISLTLEDARKAERAVAAANVRACVCFEVRHSSQMIATKSVVDSGLLGAIHYGEMDYVHGIGPWSKQFRWNILKSGGGSSLLSGGCHALDALLLCMGGDVESVSSFATRSQAPEFAAYEYPTTTVTVLRFADGRLGKVTSCLDALQPYTFHVQLIGSKGSLLGDRFQSRAIAGLDTKRWNSLAMKRLDSGDVNDHPYQAQFEAFFAAVEQGKDMPLTSLADAMRSHRVILAADRSVELGRPVALTELA